MQSCVIRQRHTFHLHINSCTHIAKANEMATAEIRDYVISKARLLNISPFTGNIFISPHSHKVPIQSYYLTEIFWHLWGRTWNYQLPPKPLVLRQKLPAVGGDPYPKFGAKHLRQTDAGSLCDHGLELPAEGLPLPHFTLSFSSWPPTLWTSNSMRHRQQTALEKLIKPLPPV